MIMRALMSAPNTLAALSTLYLFARCRCFATSGQQALRKMTIYHILYNVLMSVAAGGLVSLFSAFPHLLVLHYVLLALVCHLHSSGLLFLWNIRATLATDATRSSAPSHMSPAFPEFANPHAAGDIELDSILLFRSCVTP
ncbi:hypothetical protein OH77DRAFT_1225848 [Trametes cingulata]|nr:hypothetical protein OH77DRAFT_1225848 [Trametes cingulata]